MIIVNNIIIIKRVLDVFCKSTSLLFYHLS